MHRITNLLSLSLKYIWNKLYIYAPFFYHVYSRTCECNQSIGRYVQWSSKNASEIVEIHTSLSILYFSWEEQGEHGRSPYFEVINFQSQEVEGSVFTSLHFVWHHCRKEPRWRDILRLISVHGHEWNCKFTAAGWVEHGSLLTERANTEDADPPRAVSLHQSLLQRMSGFHSLLCLSMRMKSCDDWATIRKDAERSW